MTRKQATAVWIAGTASGVAQAGLFNPWDRALYLSVRDDRFFLHRENFRHPFLGFSQAVVQRTVSGGLYFALQGTFVALLHNLDPDQQMLTAAQHSVAVGVLAGSANGLALNQLATVKYTMWNAKNPTTFLSTAHHMYKYGGIRPFFKGMWATGARDALFGVCYETLRHHLHARLRARRHHGDTWVVLGNMLAALAATLASAPLNYCRNVIYATRVTDRPPSIPAALLQLWRQGRAQSTLSQELHFWQRRLRIGWGSARVAVGMAFGQYVYHVVHVFLLPEETAD
eukprot:m.71900 g.71900  ORF g.71900 m.71900 type:complete len:285 (+) comp16931_c0_seq6:90-944(+)